MNSLNLTLLFLCCWITLNGVEAVTYRLFYPYGPENDDTTLSHSDDISSNEVILNVSIAYFDKYYRSIYVNSNGHLSFDSEMPHYRASSLVLPIDFNVIAAFLADIDTTNGNGNIYYRETSSQQLLQRAAAEVQVHFSAKGEFEPTSLFIATWDKVGYYRQKGDKRNSFQIVIASDGIESFAFFYYLSDGIQWLVGESKTPPTFDPPGQAGFNSEDGRYLKLPKSGTTVAFVNETNVNIPGAWVFQIGNTENGEIRPADLNTGEVVRIHELETTISTCLEGTRLCHINAKCIDYSSGFCCECLPSFYGNGKQCLEPGVPQRLNGKVFGSINGVELYDLDMHTYVVTSDGRAYTAISRVPPQLGVSLQSVSTIGAIIGWMFAVPTHPGAANGYIFTGGEFNRTAIVTFMYRNTTKSLKVFQEFLGHDALNNLRLETHVNGEIPEIAPGSKVTVDDYKENYRRVSPGVIKSYSTRTYRVNDVAYRYNHDQTINYKECHHDDTQVQDIMRLSVSRNFVVFDNSNQVVRFAMSNKVSVHTGTDPCRDSAQNCAANADCIPEGQTYRCVCHTGYVGDGTICEDYDECQDANTCDENARCFNVQGSFRCQCLTGFRGDGLVCVTDIQLCGDKECGSEARCVYNAELKTPVCECNAGFIGDGLTCTRIEFGCNEVDNCPQNSQCIYDPDEFRYRCECIDGFSGDGETGSCISTDDRDCRNCDLNAECVYDVERFVFRCQCHAGYTGDGYRCSVLDVCSSCSQNAECYSDPRTGEYQCRCKHGYYGDGKYCETYDCRVQDLCDPNAECHPDNVVNTYLCRCKTGFRGDGRRCEAVGCNVVNDCSPNAQCVSDPRDGSRYMCQCNPGYEGDGHDCRQRIVPCNQVDNCHQYAECIYDPDDLSYRCRCGHGYRGDGYRCIRRDDVHDCQRDPSMCDPNAACLWNVDRYGCVCNQGYIGDGSSCRAFDGTGNYLIYAQGYSISKVPFAHDVNTSGQMVVYVPGQLAVAVTTDCYSGFLYWTDVAMGLIRRSRLDGTGMETVIAGLVSPEGIAIDWVGRNMYFTDSETDVVAVARVDGSYMKTLFRDNLVNPRAIVVDPRRGTIYWTDWNRNAPQIEKANMDGSERKVLIRKDLGLPNGLTLDEVTQQLCWGDAGTKRIECIRTDGLGRRIVHENAPYPFDVVLFNNILYWSDWETKGIPNIRKEGGDVNDVIPLAIGGNGRTYGLTAVRDQCPRVTNACALNNGGCRFLCLPSPGGGRTCECPDDVDPRRCNEVALLNKKK